MVHGGSCRFFSTILSVGFLCGITSSLWAFLPRPGGSFYGAHILNHGGENTDVPLSVNHAQIFSQTPGLRLESKIRRNPLQFHMNPPHAFRHEIYFGYWHWMNGENYKSIYQKTVPKTHFENYFEIGILFRQYFLRTKTIITEERFFSISNIGLGGELKISGTLWQNSIFAFSPYLLGRLGFISTGLKQYYSNQPYISLGGEILLLPGANLVFIGGWNPYFKLFYGDKNGLIHSFHGKGWENGVRICIPHHIVPPIRVGSWDLDLERFTWEVIFHRFKDVSTGLSYRTRRFRIGYGFNRL